MSDESTVKDDLFDDRNEVKVEYKTLAWGKVGDWFKGVLTDNTRQLPNNLSGKKEMQTVFVFKAKGGAFHDIVDRQVQPEATVCKEGEFWSFITGKPALLGQLKNAKLGQVVGLRFAEEKKSTTPGYNSAKIIKVYLGDMDPEYQGESQGD